jgi:Flp pilus assembly protein TadD
MKNDIDPENNNSDPSQSELVNLLQYFQNKQYDLAEKTAIALSKKFPNHPFAWTVLGAVFNQTGRLDEGLIACEKSAILEPDKAEVHNNLGSTFFKLGRLEEAEESCRQAIKLDPKNALAQNNLGSILFKLKKLEEAEKAFRIAISIQRNNVQAYYNLGNTLKALGKTEEAECAFRHEIIFHSNSHLSNDLTYNPTQFKDPTPVEYPDLYRKGMGTENIGGFLRSMALMLRPNKILEIGAGYTTPFLLEAIVNSRRVFDDGNLEESYFKDYKFDPKLIVIDDMSLGELSKKPGMQDIINSKYVEFIHGKFEDKSNLLFQEYGSFDFVWFDCGGPKEYKLFIEKYWDICSSYIFFHFTYSDGKANTIHDAIYKNLKGDYSAFDIIEPHKKRQGSITIIKKNSMK